MTYAARIILLLLPPVALHAQKPKNPLVIAVGNGSTAGTYTAPGANVVCMTQKSEHSLPATYKNFDTKGPKVLADSCEPSADPKTGQR